MELVVVLFMCQCSHCDLGHTLQCYGGQLGGTEQEAPVTCGLSLHCGVLGQQGNGFLHVEASPRGLPEPRSSFSQGPCVLYPCRPGTGVQLAWEKNQAQWWPRKEARNGCTQSCTPGGAKKLVLISV